MKKRIKKKVDRHIKAWLSQHQPDRSPTPRCFDVHTVEPIILRAVTDITPSEIFNLRAEERIERAKRRLVRALVDDEAFQQSLSIRKMDTLHIIGVMRYQATLRVLLPEPSSYITA